MLVVLIVLVDQIFINLPAYVTVISFMLALYTVLMQRVLLKSSSIKLWNYRSFKDWLLLLQGEESVPMGLIILNDDDEIEWMNDYMCNEISRDNMNAPINRLFPNIMTTLKANNISTTESP